MNRRLINKAIAKAYHCAKKNDKVLNFLGKRFTKYS